jgi:signal transduction histidine kinase
MQLRREIPRQMTEVKPEPLPKQRRSWPVRLPFLPSLQAQLIIPYVLLTLLTAMIGLFIVTRLVTSSARERFINQLFESSRVAADGVVRQESTHLEELRLMSFMQGVPEAFDNRDAESLEQILFPLAYNNDIDAVVAIDLNGMGILTMIRDPETADYLVGQGENYNDYDLVTDVLNQVEDDYGDKFAAILDTSVGPFLFTSAPVLDDDGRLVGVLMVGERMDELLMELKQQALSDLVVLALDGDLVATTMVEPDEGFDSLLIEPAEVSDAMAWYNRDIDMYGRDYQAAYAPFYIRNNRVGILGVVLPSNYVISTISTSRNVFSLIFSAGTVAVIIVGYALARSISSPILRLKAISQSVASGDLEQHSGIEREDEIGELADSFDMMTHRLKERTAEAERLHAETVRRNEELAEINARLQSAQAQLVQSEKLAAVGQLTAGIVHDVKNPLAVIKGMAEELGEESGMDVYVIDGLRTIRESAAKASTIVTDLLKFARQSTPEMHPRDMRQTIESSARLTEYLARKGKVEVEIEIPANAVIVTYDAQQIEQVLINLITNAIQAMPDGGNLKLSLRSEDDQVVIKVSDDGIGIRKRDLARIFDPFFTTKPEGEGTGLGLSVSYGIVTRHGGSIDVDSLLGQGTTFTIVLPKEPIPQVVPNA